MTDRDGMPEARPARRLTFIGTATMLLQLGQFTVLTDPNFLHRGQRAYLGWGLTAKRLTEPTHQPADLPPLDAILLSHMHGDHWDRIARRGLDARTTVPTTPQAARRLGRQGFHEARQLRTWENTTLDAKSGETLTVTAVPGRHAPGLAQRLLPPVMGSVSHHRAADGSELCLYITGDTLLIADLAHIPQHVPRLDVMAIHLGGTRLPGGLKVTMDAEDGADLMEMLTEPRAIPIHNDDYTLFKSPLALFRQTVSRRDLAHRVRYAPPGEPIDLDRLGEDSSPG
jgi:L-ascorbate metabolism protein UlaG (beta-lactamase superfamily)